MATLCEMIVFSFNSNSWNLSGFNTFFGSETQSRTISHDAHALKFKHPKAVAEPQASLTIVEDFDAAQHSSYGYCIGDPLDSQDGCTDDEQGAGDVYAVNVL